MSVAGEGMRVLRWRAQKREERDTVGSNRWARGEGREKENEGGGVRLYSRPHGEMEERSDSAQTWRLRAAPTAVGGAHLVGAGCAQGRTTACATWDGAADRWDLVTSGPGGQRLGAGESGAAWRRAGS
jgi:hypothetical protein